MNRGRARPGGGYTIVETLIFLAVSGAMFISAMAFLGGKQGKAEFGQSVRDFESSLQSIANDISNGYYADISDQGNQFSCSVSATVTITQAANNNSQGTNKDCIFVGKAVQLGPVVPGKLSAKAGYTTFTLVGKRLDINNQPVTDYASAGMVAAFKTSGIPPQDVTSSNPFEYGATVVCAFYSNSAVTLPGDKPCTNPPPSAILIDTVSFITTFQGTDVVNGGRSGSTQVDLVVPTAPASIGARGNGNAAALVNTYAASPASYKKNPAGGIYVCLQSGGSKQYGVIKLGGASSQFATSSIIESGSCS